MITTCDYEYFCNNNLELEKSCIILCQLCEDEGLIPDSYFLWDESPKRTIYLCENHSGDNGIRPSPISLPRKRLSKNVPYRFMNKE